MSNSTKVKARRDLINRLPAVARHTPPSASETSRGADHGRRR
jgi:hypothetical protein